MTVGIVNWWRGLLMTVVARVVPLREPGHRSEVTEEKMEERGRERGCGKQQRHVEQNRVGCVLPSADREVERKGNREIGGGEQGIKIVEAG
jgi:hypothetical protein